MAQSRKKQTVFQVYENKRKASEKRNKTRVYLGDSFPQWRALKALTGIPTDASFAKFLMDSYERSSQGCPPPSKDKAQPLRPPVSGVTSSSDPNSDQVCPTPCKGTDEPLRLPVSSVTGSSDPKSDRVYPTPCKGTDEPLGPPVSSVPGSCDPKRESVYIKEEPVVSSSNEVELDSMASLSDPSSELEQEVKTEPASCEDVSENKENKDEDGDISASLSVGDGYYLVDLGSSSEFVVDEACILELFRSCQRCSRHCRVMKRVQGLKIVVNQRCCYCDNRFEWTNLPDGFSDEEDGDLHITDRRQLTAA
ncbi:uncharacterized protein LOC110368069 isoform X3 [Fundulus heteroclitus]|uniref:uncharacterized protein LOC110368069 isoform X3 n=1 Tax=Fundulus heteroclitus TaxID=8078 RepID=UPI00165AB7FA|nr:uncharacterized protein LOC110368069 isoform X3 [Fundulus heteroclitus]